MMMTIIVAYRPVMLFNRRTNARFYATVELLSDHNNGNGVFYVVHVEML
jgi:hypothetical protein